jgi:AcrR family transcriptional regulator
MEVQVVVPAAGRIGLRERKKQKTRQTIVEVATRLFADRGYAETTLAQVADEAEVALSTIFNYFPGKPDIVFAAFDAIIESARDRIVGRPGEEDASSAILAWITEVLPDVELPYTEAIRRLPRIMLATPELRGEERLRYALIEDALGEGFARDLGEPAGGMRARVMAAVAIGGMLDVWNDWYALHATDAEFDLTELLGLKAAHVAEALAAGLEAIEGLPRHTVTTAR